MANVSHASLTGSNLHEPKGADSATLGTVYVANGAGSGSWNSIGTSAFTGMIADFAAPVAPTGWLELDGSIISTSTFSALYAVMSITSSGTRTNGSAVITSIPSTTTFRVGYFVFGTGITTGSTILSIDSATQITISIAATSSGSSVFAVSPWLLNTGTIQLPDVTTAGRYRRSRTSSTSVGQVIADTVATHTHSVSGTTASTNTDHTHGASLSGSSSGSFGGFVARSNLSITSANVSPGGAGALPFAGGATWDGPSTYSGSASVSGTTGTMNSNTAHTHGFSTTTGSTGGTETRPVSLICLTCVKT